MFNIIRCSFNVGGFLILRFRKYQALGCCPYELATELVLESDNR